MNRWMKALAAVVVLLAARDVQAQFRPPSNTQVPPSFSPYLNLFRSGNPAIGYFGYVQPLEQLQHEQQQLQQQAAASAVAATTTTRTTATTGSSARFMSYGGYFGNVGGQRVGTPAAPPGYSTPIVPLTVGGRH